MWRSWLALPPSSLTHHHNRFRTTVHCKATNSGSQVVASRKCADGRKYLCWNYCLGNGAQTLVISCPRHFLLLRCSACNFRLRKFFEWIYRKLCFSKSSILEATNFLSMYKGFTQSMLVPIVFVECCMRQILKLLIVARNNSVTWISDPGIVSISFCFCTKFIPEQWEFICG